MGFLKINDLRDPIPGSEGSLSEGLYMQRTVAVDCRLALLS
jgi:hypothetical protein